MSQSKKSRKKKLSIFRLILVIVLLATFIAVGAGMGIVAAYIKDAPEISYEDIINVTQSSKIIEEATGKEVATVHAEINRTVVPLNKIPKHVQNAFIAIEDERFRKHFGIDIKRIVGAAIVNIRERSLAQGGSTITQQLVRNLVLSQEKKFKRKIQEAYLAIKLERMLTKDQILEAYLNTIYFGHGAYGVQAAARTYFDKDVSQLTIAEGAMIAGTANSPGLYSPYLHFENAKRRQELVLKQMLEQGYINQQEYEEAVNQELKLKRGEINKDEIAISPYFIDQVKLDVIKDLMEKYNYSEGEAAHLLYYGGLRIYSTIDTSMQKAVEEAFKNPENFPKTEKDSKGIIQPQGAMVIIDYTTGKIKAMVGGRGQTGQLILNRATQSFRQPGSAIKPLTVYTAAVDNGYTAATVIDDVPVAFRDGSGQLWIPKNWYRDSQTKLPTFWGLSTVRKAIQWSMNVIAVKVADDIGVDTAIDYAQRLGITSLVKEGKRHDRNLAAVALGGLTKGVCPLDMAVAYGTLANDGVYIEPITYTKVVDPNGNTILEKKPVKRRVISEEVAYIMTDMLTSVVKAGTGTNANIGSIPVAGKTGTTSDSKDAWFVGYTPYYVASVWMGHDEPKSMGIGGGSYPAILWRRVMEEIHKDLPAKNFNKPENIITVAVDTVSGKLPTDLSYLDPRGTVRNEVFVKGTEPTEYDDVHVLRDVCVTSNKLATPFCPPTLVESRVFIQRPQPYSPEKFLESIGGADPRMHLIPSDAVYEVPIEYCPLHNPFSLLPGDDGQGDQQEQEGQVSPGDIIDRLLEGQQTDQ